MPTYETTGSLTTQTKSFPSPKQPNLRNLAYSLNGQSITVVVVGSPGTASEESITQPLDGASEYDLSWSNSHTDFHLEVDFSTTDDSTTPVLDDVIIQNLVVDETGVFTSATGTTATSTTNTTGSESSFVVANGVPLQSSAFGIATESSPTVTETFTYTGSKQQWTVPEGVGEITVEAIAPGGHGSSSLDDGGAGGYAKATYSVSPGDVLDIWVSEHGGKNGFDNSGWGRFDGGKGGEDPDTTSTAGGGAGSTEVANATEGVDYLAAGGGGGAGGADTGGGGGAQGGLGGVGPDTNGEDGGGALDFGGDGGNDGVPGGDGDGHIYMGANTTTTLGGGKSAPVNFEGGEDGEVRISYNFSPVVSTSASGVPVVSNAIGTSTIGTTLTPLSATAEAVSDEAVATESGGTFVVPTTRPAEEVAKAIESAVRVAAFTSSQTAVTDTFALESAFVTAQATTQESFLLPLSRIGIFANDKTEIKNTGGD